MELITSLLLVNIYTGRNFIQELPFLFLCFLLFTFKTLFLFLLSMLHSVPSSLVSILLLFFLHRHAQLPISSSSSFLRTSLFVSSSLPLCVCLGSVVDNLQTAGFFNDKVTKSCLFTTVHDAVLYCQSAITQSQSLENEVWALKHTHHGTWWRMSTFFDIYLLQVIKLHSISAFSNTQPLIWCLRVAKFAGSWCYYVSSYELDGHTLKSVHQIGRWRSRKVLIIACFEQWELLYPCLHVLFSCNV